MPSKLVELKRAGMLTPRERVWEAVRKLRNFSVLELQDATEPVVTLRTCEDYALGLARAGFLEATQRQSRAQRGVFTEGRYRLVKDCLDAPRVDVEGKAAVQGLARLAMWRAMQVLKTFDYHDVQRAATLPVQRGVPSVPVNKVSPDTAKKYVNTLARAGYFSTVEAASGGKPARFRLARNTGAHAPAITRRQVVFDRNEGKFAWQENEQEVVDGIE